MYSTTASSVTPSSLQDYWFVIVSAFVVLLLSYLAASILQPCFRIQQRDFQALRISSTFPNVVAIPILIFPSLCEYEVIQQGYFGDSSGADNANSSLQSQCVSVSNAMVFCYFFSWSLAFWSFGYPLLLATAHSDTKQSVPADAALDQQEQSQGSAPSSLSDSSLHSQATLAAETLVVGPGNGDPLHVSEHVTAHSGGSAQQTQQSADNTSESTNQLSRSRRLSSSIYKQFVQTLKQILKTAPFWALVLGIATGCIGPLRNALFSQGGALRFIGGALESLGQASSPITTIVVAASLVPDPSVSDTSSNGRSSHDDATMDHDSQQLPDESPIMSEPTVGPPHLRRRSSITRFKQSLRKSSRAILGRSNPELRKQLIWFTLNRLLLAPALVAAVLIGFDCGGLLHGIPRLAQVVILVNACVPGAFIVVVVLKQKEEMAELAEVVARVYLPTYLLSIVTVAGWTALGLWLTLPDENGQTFCERMS